MKTFWPALALCCLATSALAGPMEELDEFATYATAGLKAYNAGDWASSESNFGEAYRHEPQRALALYYIAASAAHRGESAKALATLDRFADFGTGKALDIDNAFAGLKGGAEYARIAAKFARNTAPRCACRVSFEGSKEPFIAEGLAFDSVFDRFLVAGVNARKILSIRGGHVQDYASVPDGMSALGIHINDAHDILWAAASSLPQSKDATPAQQGRAALMAFNLTSGALVARYDAPPAPDGNRSLNDLAIAPDGTIYTSDAIEGSIFKLKPGADSLDRVGTPALLKSPQGMVVSGDGKTLLVADYSAGLVTVDIASGQLTQVAVPQNATTIAIDGLVQMPDGSFVATQNGVHPARLVRFRLSRNWEAVTTFDVVAQGPEIPEPTLLARDGNDVFVIGTSQWHSFDDSATPARPLPAWRILRVKLS
jgi:sugar lactone lactonase YvrE